MKAKNHQIGLKPIKSKPLNSKGPSRGEPIQVTSDNLLDEVPRFKCPDCGCEKAVYIQSHEPLYSKRSHLLIKCSGCGKAFRDTDY